MPGNRWTVRKETQTLYLLFISGFCTCILGAATFHLINKNKTYTEAKTYCRDMYSDLAAVHNSTEMDNLNTLVQSTVARAWIGLEAGDVWMWHWSGPDQKLDFLNWKVGKPQIKNADACATMDQRGEWLESDCGTERSFVCCDNSNSSGLIFVSKKKSWRSAQTHCRGLSSELISIHSAVENEAVRNVSGSHDVWIGLFKDPWKWSDGSDTSFRYWKPSQPNNFSGQNCVAAVFKDKGQWNDLKCGIKRFFVCRGARKSIPTNAYQTSTQQMTANLTTHQSTSTQVIVTYHFTLATTNESQSPNPNVTTDKPTSANELTTTNSTLVSSTPNTEPNTVTSAQPLPDTTAQATTGPASTLTTLAGTSAQTPTPTSTPSAPSGNLILIRENLTWIEAMGYCREHHIDLVHITTGDIQGKVAETARDATSPHVWLGLRYTCTFDFWFWTKSTSGCYHNWAPEQGSEGKYDCGVTGAIEATGRQQWVGLPETEQLNFICYTCTG